ncbi:unnamed protein product [Darwinula stevensoni]|uniref:Proteasome assembly chaperone 3 n=1 Tax=Darwinula stevensoni TaxID=69355 RepID=A0A7R8X4P5_9CRUS|nr:unnamed protein product [Darwinula stevensoni]CAG0886264.1 unnamed protein product [Darwinula stevensoni]
MALASTECFPVKSATACEIVEGKATDVLVSDFGDRLFVVVTQFQKIGTLIEVRKDVARREHPADVYSTRVLLGKDCSETHLVARFIAEKVNIDKPILVGVSLVDYSPGIVRKVTDLVVKNLVA